jgi:hypothetical protein
MDDVARLMKDAVEASKRPEGGPQRGMTDRERQAYAEGLHAAAGFMVAAATALQAIVARNHPDKAILHMFVDTHVVMVRMAADGACGLLPPGFEP